MQLLRVLKKYNLILSSYQKKRILQLGILMIVASILETVCVSMILPFTNALLNPEEIFVSRYFCILSECTRIVEYRSLMILDAVLIAALYVIKNVYLLIQMTLQNRFVYNQMLLTEKRLLYTMLHRPYTFFLQARSGELLRIIEDDTREAFKILTDMLSLASELVISAALIAALFVAAPLLTLILGFLIMLVVFLILIVTRPILVKAGVLKQKSFAKMKQWILQSIQGIKEIKLKQCERYFEKNYAEEGKKYVRSLYQGITLGMTPRYLLEAALMGIMFSTVAAMLFIRADIEGMIPIFTMIVMAASRLLPSASRISTFIGNIAYGEVAVNKLIENIDYVENEPSGAEGKHVALEEDGKWEKCRFDSSVAFEHVSYHYPAREVNVLEDTDLKIEKGNSVGFVGMSGAGKTTAVDVLLGLLVPQQGRISVDGLDIQENMRGWRANIGYIPQSIFILDGTVRENVAFGEDPEEVNDERVWETIREAALEDFVNELPEGLDTQLGERGLRLSGGQRQRIGIARALYENPDLLIFDEATSALDNETESMVMDSIMKLQGKKTMIIIAHRLSTIEACDHVYRVENGRFIRER